MSRHHPTDLHPDTAAIIEQAEHVSGFSVDLRRDAQLSVPATVKLAGHEGRDRHQLLLRSDAEHGDYLIAWQAGLIIRQFRKPPGQRRWMLRSERALVEVRRALQPQASHLPDEQLNQIATYLADGVLLQLRSVPVGLVIDTWLYRDYPALRVQQRAVLLLQSRDHLVSLDPEHDRLPARIIAANRAMNAAQVLHADGLFQVAGLGEPYRRAGLEPLARRLLGALNEAPELIDDTALIESWAAVLELEGWYRWLATN